jgi:recombinational DNA repair ATPase RecF
LLLDDVFSELDRTRGEALVSRLPAGGQTIVTATDRPDVLHPDLVVAVKLGEARAA